MTTDLIALVQEIESWTPATKFVVGLIGASVSAVLLRISIIKGYGT